MALQAGFFNVGERLPALLAAGDPLERADFDPLRTLCRAEPTGPKVAARSLMPCRCSRFRYCYHSKHLSMAKSNIVWRDRLSFVCYMMWRWR